MAGVEVDAGVPQPPGGHRVLERGACCRSRRRARRAPGSRPRGGSRCPAPAGRSSAGTRRGRRAARRVGAAVAAGDVVGDDHGHPPSRAPPRHAPRVGERVTAGQPGRARRSSRAASRPRCRRARYCCPGRPTAWHPASARVRRARRERRPPGARGDDECSILRASVQSRGRRRPPRQALNWPPPGGIPERSKGTGCKPVGSAFEGSNPSPTITSVSRPLTDFPGQSRRFRSGPRKTPDTPGHPICRLSAPVRRAYLLCPRGRVAVRRLVAVKDQVRPFGDEADQRAADARRRAPRVPAPAGRPGRAQAGTLAVRDEFAWSTPEYFALMTGPSCRLRGWRSLPSPRTSASGSCSPWPSSSSAAACSP